MTTLVYANNTFCADTLVTCAGFRDGIITKIAEKNGVFCGACGILSEHQAFLDWFRSGMNGAHPPLGEDDECQTNAVLIHKPDELILFEKRGPSKMRMIDGFYCAGSGWKIAYGALYAGATAEQALRAAMRFDTGSGEDITVLRR